MQNKIVTQEYGERVIQKMELIKGTKDLYLAEVLFPHSRKTRVHGILDSEYREVVPFGYLRDLLGIRVVNEDIVIVDTETYSADHNVGGWSDNGSYLIMKPEGKYQVVYKSTATVIRVVDNLLLGAHYVMNNDPLIVYDFDDPDEIKTFEYDYVENKMVGEKTFNYHAVFDGDLEEYLVNRSRPYPRVMKRLELDSRKTSGRGIYKFKDWHE